MENRDSSFVIHIARSRIAQVHETLRKRSPGRGSSLIDYVSLLLDDLEKRLADIETEIAEAPAGNRAIEEAYLRQLLRLLPILSVMHRLVAKYSRDVGRSDLSVGLQYLVAEVITDLLPDGADPLIHLSSSNMYSTLALEAGLKELSLAISGSSRPMPIPAPVVFNLPGINPEIILYSPILVHEVGHTAAQRSLFGEVASQWDQVEIERVFHQNLAQLGTSVPPEVAQDWSGTFAGWVEETLCDALAVVLTGPSFLFSMCVFLPAPSLNEPGSHPQERDRVQHCLDLLGQLGWNPFIRMRFPEVFDWATEIAIRTVPTRSPKESFLREGLKLALPAIDSVARTNVKSALSTADIDDVLSEAIGFLKEGIPVVEANGAPISTWQATLCGWTLGWSTHDGSVKGMSTAVHDPDLNRLVLKTIEYARIKEMWAAS